VPSLITSVTQKVRNRPLAADSLLSLALLTVPLGLIPLANPGVAFRPVPTIGWGIVSVAPIALRRWRIWWAIGATVLITNASFLLPVDARRIEQGTALMILAYTAAAHLLLRPALLATAVLWLPPLALLAIRSDTQSNTRLPPTVAVGANVLIALVLFSAGRTVWTRRAYASALEDRARSAEANQHALAAKAVAEERRRVARELHDIVAHHISVMSVLASGARRTLPRDPAAADETLATIEQTGRTVLREMRRLLDLLRTGDGEPGDPMAPQPGLGAVSALVEQVRDAGLPVKLHCDDRLDQIDPGLALTVYRIVQEALTNVIKHAGMATAEVRLTVTAGQLRLEISDTGRGPRLDGHRHGHGLIGMHERVAIFGGTLRVGPRPGGGFQLRAMIPIEAPGTPETAPAR
jgi:signal transduction histidine kinase